MLTRTRLSIFLLSLLTVLAVGAAPATAAARQSPVLRTAQVTQFDQVAGQPAWKSRALQRMANAQWGFGTGGTFAFDTTDVRRDLYPLTGTFTLENGIATFNAERSVSSSTGSAHAEISGTLDPSTGQVTFRWLSTSGNAAVVNGTQFSGANGSGYTGAVTVGS